MSRAQISFCKKAVVMRGRLLIQFLWILPVVGFSQAINKEVSLLFTGNTGSATIVMSGFVDGQNTFTYPNSRVFEPMKRVTVTNQGDKVIVAPRLVVNNRRKWFDISGMRSECFDGLVNPKDRALGLWRFVRDNRLHYNEPDQGSEVDDPIKLLGVYGFGLCYNISAATAYIAAPESTVLDPYREYAPRGLHSVKDILFDTSYMLIDPDIEVFYLDYDNKRLATYTEVANDKYLMRRTHHYGKAAHYNYLNSFVADHVYDPNEPSRFNGILREEDFHKLDFLLRPGESVTYSWDTAKYFHHFFINPNSAPMSDIGNGQLVMATDFTDPGINSFADTVHGLSTRFSGNQSPNLYTTDLGDTAFFVTKITSPNVIVNAEVWASCYRPSERDQVRVSFSKDSVAWDPVWESQDTGWHTCSINLYDNIQPIGQPAVYKYFLRFDLLSTSLLGFSGLDSLRIASDFQISRAFLPALQLGENEIRYSDESEERNVRVHFEWQESEEYAPPSAVPSPIFPENGSSVDSLTFTFKWSEAVDPSGIVDYEFLLSDRSDLRFPLSPSFEIYTSQIDQPGGLTSFTIPFDGLLNSGTTYHWRVRAKNGLGVWSDWSPVWSFTATGVMPPFARGASITDRHVLLEWARNPIGNEPVLYEVHGSNEALGFTPGPATFIDTSRLTIKRLPLEESTFIFYRIVAVGTNSRRSGPSGFVSLPYPSIINPPDLVPNTMYELDLATNIATIREMASGPYPFVSTSVDDEITYKVVSAPAWIVHNEADGKMVGTPDYVQALTDSIVVEFRSSLTGAFCQQVIKGSHHINAPPVLLSPEVTEAEIHARLSQTLLIFDPDSADGDFISGIEVIHKPDWLNVKTGLHNSSVSIEGVPGSNDQGVDSLMVQVTDGVGSITTGKLKIRVFGFAELHGGDEYVRCPGDSAWVTVEYSGAGPWGFQVTDGRDTLTVDHLMGHKYTFGHEMQRDITFRLVSLTTLSGSLVVVGNDSVSLRARIFEVEKNQTFHAVVGETFSAEIQTDNPCNREILQEMLMGPSWLRLEEGTIVSIGPVPHDGISEVRVIVESYDELGNASKDTVLIRVYPHPSGTVTCTVPRGPYWPSELVPITVTYFDSFPWGFTVVNGEDTLQRRGLLEPVYTDYIVAGSGVVKLISLQAFSKSFDIDIVPALLELNEPSFGKIFPDEISVEDYFEAEISAEGYCPETYHVELLEGPPWLSVVEENKLSGTPTLGDVGLTQVVLQACDTFGNCYKLENFLFVSETSYEGIRLVSPNPFTTYLCITYLTGRRNSQVNLQVFDLEARQVLANTWIEEEEGRHEFVWQPFFLEGGYYFIRMTIRSGEKGGTLTTARVIKVE